MLSAKLRGFCAGFPYLLGRGMPVRRPMLSQETHAQTGSIDQPDSALLCEAGQHAVHVGIDQVIMAISKDAINRSRLGHAPQELRWISRDADIACLALLLQL